VPSEFELIARYFKRATSHTLLGVGDDGALIATTPGQELVISTDMLVEGTHFLADTDAEDLGWKTLAVNVSDMAAMGALPRWATLAAALPDTDPAWIEDFARGFFACADRIRHRPRRRRHHARSAQLLRHDFRRTAEPEQHCAATVRKPAIRSGYPAGRDAPRWDWRIFRAAPC
jgi:hypothetical protein